MHKFNTIDELKEYISECENKNTNDKMIISFCSASGCVANKSNEIKAKFEKLIKLERLEDKVETKCVGCFGLCSQGPFVRIHPDNVTYKLVKESDVEEIFLTHILGGKIVDRLVFKNENGENELDYQKISFFNKQQRTVLKGCEEIDPTNIDDAFKIGAYKGLARCLESLSSQEVIDEVSYAGLRGRGGGGYPTGKKWASALREDSEIKYVICNADEGDPGAFMDGSILESNPHAVVEGMLIAGYAIGACQGFIYVRAEYPHAVQRFKTAILAARECGLLGKNILGSNFSFDIEIRLGAGAFVCGEETALIASIESQRGMPRAKPPYPSQKGLFSKPTIINNVETFANLPFILKEGGKEKFHLLGSETSKGTKVFALAGKVNNVGLVEVEMGTTLRELIYDIGGGILDNKKFKAIQTGGPSGGCLTEKDLDTPIDFDTLLARGSMMGSGGAIVMDEDNCMIDVAKFYLQFIVDESCGKCSPCRIGSKAMLNILEKITDGRATLSDLDELERLAYQIKNTALCGLGQSAPNPILSTLKNFKEEYVEHIVEHKCRAKVCRKLVEYSVLSQKCKKCGLCARNCPVDAIGGVVGKKTFVIDKEKCIKCGLCLSNCPFEAIVKE